MKSTRLIKQYSSWLNESLNEEAPASQPAIDAVTFISASSSASNLGPNLAAQMGVKVNTLYTIQLNTLSHLNFVFQDGKFGGDQAKSRGVTIDEGTAIAAGQDILEIGGKKIVETGSIIFTKAELAGPITIKASNNGLLTLIRFGEGLYKMSSTYKNYLGGSVDWAAKFSMGGNVAEKDSRGFSFWFAKPGELNPDSSSIAMVLAMTMLKAAGFEDRIAVNDPVFSGWYKAMIAGKTPQDTIKAMTDRIALTLEKRMMLAQKPAGDASGAWNIPNPFNLVDPPEDWTRSKVKLDPAGAKALEPIVDAIAKAVTPTAPPPGFGAESQAVFAAYSKIINTGLTSKRTSVAYWFAAVQEIKDWQSGSARPGQTGQGTATQGEGQFGKPAPKPGTPTPGQNPPQK
jgi:hypothetical protein